MQEHFKIEKEKLSDIQVSDFLRNNPTFFERNASLLADIYLPSPHGNGAISLTERQQLAQRDKIRTTEALMAEIVSFGQLNDQISHKIHLFSLALLTHTNFVQIPNILSDHIQQAFLVEYVHLHLWANTNDSSLLESTVFEPLTDSFKQWVMSFSAPYCGEKPEIASGISDDSNWHQAQSIACIPIFSNLSSNKNSSNMIGVVTLASQDAQRFQADMGKLFLQRIGDLISAALARHFQ